jgi:hypothetical protein
VLAAAAILAWRIRVHPVSTLWLDWIVALAAFWIFTALAGRTRAWPWVMGAVMTGLLALYAGHQVPLTLGLLGALR